ncbi:MAG: ABC transporter permease [Gemmatimonas sp.]|jgi:putative ABC transport system permease protein|uniref:ABC transporter permease n=1 Tax=Gemmatimonas sp. TaxID=1962908 RepID=UPI0031BC4C8B|nr:ABC transporter permease [Gemmatimonas sp.]
MIRRRLLRLSAAGALLVLSGMTATAAAQSDTSLSPTSGRRAPTVRGIAVDARMAEDLGLRPGSIVRLSGKPGMPGDSVRVDAVFERKADPAEVARREYRIRTHVDHLQALLGLDDRVDRFAVGVPDSVSVDSAIARINHVAFGFRAHKSTDVAVQSSRTFRVVERFHKAIGLITVVASAVFLLCLLLLSVEERRRDIAALRLMGISQGTVVRAIVMEAALVSIIGSVIGAAIGWIASIIVNAHFQQVYRTPLLFALLTPEIFAFATLTSLVLGIGAGALAAWRLVRTPPLTLMGR